jgi:hypothetical protein
LYFSWTVQELSFFKGAWDEDTYALFPYGPGTPRQDRLLAATLFMTLRTLTGGGYAPALVLADVLLPALAGVCAYWVAAAFLTSNSARLLLVIGLIFGQDLLSLGNGTLLGWAGISLGSYRSLFGDYGDLLVPPYETSYLGIFRTPEPQASYAVFFVVLGLLIRILNDRGGTAPRNLLLALGTADAVLVVSFIILSLPALFLQTFVAILLCLCNRRKSGMIVGALAIATIALMVIATWAQAGYIGDNFLLHSRFPVLTVSVVLGLIGIVIWMVVFIRRPYDPLTWFSLALMAMPVALCNQQLLTGRMISVRDWEFYVNYPSLILGVALLVRYQWSSVGWASGRRVEGARWALVGLLIMIIIPAQKRFYGSFELLNLKSVALAQALADAAPRMPTNTTLILEEPVYAPLLAVRRGGERNSLLDLTDVFLEIIPRLDTADFRLTKHAAALFEYWRRNSIDVRRARALLEHEAEARTGLYLAFLFNWSDFWFPGTDSRNVKDAEIRDLIPRIIDLYANYLSGPSESDNRPFVMLTHLSSRAVHKAKPGYRFELLGAGMAGGVVEWAYAQYSDPTATPPTVSDVVIGRKRYRAGDLIAEISPADLARWRAYKKDQSIDVMPEGIVLHGEKGAGLFHEFKTAELGLMRGDLVQFQVEADNVRSSDFFSIQGEIAADPRQIEAPRISSAWHSLAADASAGMLEASARIMGNRFVVYIYSESQTIMKVKYLHIRRLVPICEGEHSCGR